MAVFSIIVPVYNSEKYLHKCLDSIVAQTYADYEVLLVDNGSSDASNQICEDYALKDERFKVLFKSGGVSRARNHGLDKATGNYITFVDSDDYLEPNALNSYLEAFEDKQVDAVKCGYYKEDESGNKKQISVPEKKTFSDKSDCFKYMEDNQCWSFVWNLCVRRECTKDIRFNESINYCEDIIFSYNIYIHIYECSRRISIVPTPVYHYVVKDKSVGSLSHVCNPQTIYEASTLQHDLKQTLNSGKHPIIDDQNKACYLRNIHRIVAVLYTTGDNGYSREAFSKLKLRYKPIYREDKIFFNRYIPFLIKDILIKGYYYIHGFAPYE